MMIEGEEEVGSDNLEGFLRNNVEKLKSDVSATVQKFGGSGIPG